MTYHDWAFGGMGGYCVICGSDDYNGPCPPGEISEPDFGEYEEDQNHGR